MTHFDFLGDDALIDALLVEVADLMLRFTESGEEGAIDLLGLPLSQNCLAALEQNLGQGEVFVRLDTAGCSEIHETRFPGVWWSKHADEAGRIIALLIEVAFVPNILRADVDDMRAARQGLLASTRAAMHASRSAA